MSYRRTQFKPLELPEYTDLSIRINNLLLNKSRMFSFALNPEKSFRVKLKPGDTQTATLYPNNFTIGLGDSIAGLWLADWPLAERIREFIPEGMLKRLPENLGIALIENAMEPLLVMAEHGFGTKINIQSLSAEIDSKHYTLPIGFELIEMEMKDGAVQKTRQISGLLMVEERTYPLLQERLRFWPSDESNLWDKLETPIRFEISKSELTLAELNALNLSDIILLSETDFYSKGQIKLCINQDLCCKAIINPEKNSLTIHSEWNNMAEQEQKNGIENLSQVPVQLTFDLGSKAVSFNEIRQLKPGSIMELSTQLPEIVQIRSQNKLIGTGELVEVSGRIGVRITSLFGKNKAE